MKGLVFITFIFFLNQSVMDCDCEIQLIGLLEFSAKDKSAGQSVQFENCSVVEFSAEKHLDGVLAQMSFCSILVCMYIA